MIPQRVHFVGIGGEGMSAIAIVLAARGHVVTGSDVSDGPLVARLRASGIDVRRGHGELPETDLVVCSPAIPAGNVELDQARTRGLPCVRRAALLGRLTGATKSLGLAGSHGKTTTTGLVAQVLARAGLDPTVIIGGTLRGGPPGAAAVGQGPLVFEACEGYHALDHTPCDFAYLGNVDDDHVEQYAGGFAELEASFRRWVETPRALTVVCGDDPRLAAWASARPSGLVTVGEQPGNAVRALIHEATFDGSSFMVAGGDLAGESFTLPLPGVHNVRNALGALVLTTGFGVPVDVVRDALALAVAPRRRLERIGTWQGVELIDDYAHHPTEVAAGLAALRLLTRRDPSSRLIVAFQPTLYSRTLRLAARFAEALGVADVVLLTDIAPREEAARPIPAGVDSELIAAPLRRAGVATHMCGTVARTLAVARDLLRPGDVFVTMGSGAIGDLGRALVDPSAPAQGDAHGPRVALTSRL